MLEVQAAEHADPLIGKVLLGRYRPLSVLGEGGMGKVYLAEQKMGTATRKVAIKTLHPELANDPQLIARFQRESETVIELRHPNTIQFYDFGELDDGTLIIVMEYIQGKPLAKVLEESGVVDPSRADTIIIQVCGSLHEAHQRGIVHRDLKPENVLLTDQGGQTDFVKVLDFGIAKRDDAEDASQAKLTKQGMVLGTPPYMSPEQFSGQKLDARSDIYSLGVMVYEMLAGKLPFEAATPWEWATKHLTAQPTSLDAYPISARVPQNKKAAVMRALAKSPDDRQPSVLAFLEEFTGYRDANAAWTMATSSGGAKPGAPAARPPAPTPGPMQQGSWGSPTPPPSGVSSNPGFGSAPGMMPSPYGSHPGASPPSHPGYAGQSYPGQSYPGQPSPGQSYSGHSYPGYSTGPQAVSGGGIMGKLVAVAVVGFFILAGGAVGVAWYLSDDSVDDRPVAGIDPPETQHPSDLGTVMQPADPTDPPMVPTSPGTPTAPVEPEEPTMPDAVEPAGVEPEAVEPEADEDPEPVTPVRTPPRGPSAADEARARAVIATGMGAARRNDFAGAVTALRQAQRSVGRNHRITTELRSELARRGSNQVGILLQQGRCPQAQALYRQLQGVGAGADARRQFGDWCPAR